MTNIFGNPKKSATKRDLFSLAIVALEKKGWKVERIPGLGKSSVRRIVRGSEIKTVSIRTSQDTWIAFPRNGSNTGWGTLSEVDYVVAASVDDRDNPQFAQVHMIDGDEMRQRFDRAFAARKAAGHSLPLERGIWVSLYHEEATDPVNRVGAGAGLTNAPIARIALKEIAGSPKVNMAEAPDNYPVPPVRIGSAQVSAEEKYLSIPEAKRLLALSLGVSESDIKITISS